MQIRAPKMQRLDYLTLWGCEWPRTTVSYCGRCDHRFVANFRFVQRATIEGLGGKIESAYYAFGDDDVVAIIEFPDNITAASFSVAGSAGGAIKSIKTTPLMTMAEGVQVMQKAAGAGYRPPGS